jgi:natural product precursor
MKTKIFSKKLTLSKKTIAHLNDKEMKDVNGGWELTDSNPSFYPPVCCLYPPSQILC